ncbi:MAG: hypothetical protein WEB88_07715 [Gemmatimonadota bacterium]
MTYRPASLRGVLQARREGFALPMAILVIGVLTAGITAAFVRVTNEQQVQFDQGNQVDALALAQTGLERYLSDRASLGLTVAPPPAVETATLNLPGGTAEIEARQLRPAIGDDPPLYVIRSTGRTVRSQMARTGGGEHTVAQIGYWGAMTLDVKSGWTSLTGLKKKGVAGTLSGEDNCGEEADLAGVAVPDGGYDQNGGADIPQGDPGIDYMGTEEEMAEAINIDWDGIVNDGLIQPDIVISTSGQVGTLFPSAGFFNANPDYWPVIEIRNFNYDTGTPTWNFSLPNSGRGTLIVHGNMTISGGKQWQGILLVGHGLTSNGNNTVTGATVSGLNEKLGYDAPTGDVGNGTKTFQYDSCDLAAASAAMGNMRAYPNAWVDNWNVW